MKDITKHRWSDPINKKAEVVDEKTILIYNTYADFLIDSSDSIAIAEHFKTHGGFFDEMQNMSIANDELKAHIERLRGINHQVAMSADVVHSDFVINSLQKANNETPKQSLSRHDAEVRKEFVDWCDDNIDLVATIATPLELIPLFEKGKQKT